MIRLVQSYNKLFFYPYIQFYNKLFFTHIRNIYTEWYHIHAQTKDLTCTIVNSTISMQKPKILLILL